MHDYEYGEKQERVLQCFRKMKTFYNKTWLWTKIECAMLDRYNRTRFKPFKKLLRAAISNEKAMEFFYRINKVFLPNKIQHIFLLLKK